MDHLSLSFLNNFHLKPTQVDAYARMGLWRRAQRLTRQAIDIYRRSGSNLSEWNGHFVLSRIELEMGHVAAAREAASEALRLAKTGQAPVLQAFMHQMVGDLALRTGDAAAAEREIAIAVEGMRKMPGTMFEAIVLPYLAQARLALGDIRGALEASRRGASLHRSKKLVSHAGIDSGAHIWWTHYEALHASGVRNLL